MNIKTTGRSWGVAVILCFVTANGCMWAPELTDVKQDIAQQLPDTQFHKNVTLSFGPLTLALARVVTGLIPDAREARRYLRDVSHVQIAVYDIERSEALKSVDTPSKLEGLLEDGWEMAARVRDDDEVVWLLYRMDDESVRQIFVVVLDDDQLVMVKASGHLEKLMARALEESHGDWSHFPPPGA